MTTSRIIAAAAATLVAGSALAADLPRRTAPAAPAMAAIPTFVWTGFYGGINAGYGFGQISGSAGPRFKDPSGFIGGAQIGYNHQVGQMVFGLETDLSLGHLRADNSAAGVPGGKVGLDYLGTVRGRVGFAVDRFMPYLTGGFAYGGGTVREPVLGKTNTTHLGWVLGGGVEYAITNNITAKIEGLYVDLSDEKVLSNTRKAGHEAGIVRAGINYKF